MNINKSINNNYLNIKLFDFIRGQDKSKNIALLACSILLISPLLYWAYSLFWRERKVIESKGIECEGTLVVLSKHFNYNSQADFDKTISSVHGITFDKGIQDKLRAEMASKDYDHFYPRLVEVEVGSSLEVKKIGRVIANRFPVSVLFDGDVLKKEISFACQGERYKVKLVNLDESQLKQYRKVAREAPKRFIVSVPDSKDNVKPDVVNYRLDASVKSSQAIKSLNQIVKVDFILKKEKAFIIVMEGIDPTLDFNVEFDKYNSMFSYYYSDPAKRGDKSFFGSKIKFRINKPCNFDKVTYKKGKEGHLSIDLPLVGSFEPTSLAKDN